MSDIEIKDIECDLPDFMVRFDATLTFNEGETITTITYLARLDDEGDYVFTPEERAALLQEHGDTLRAIAYEVWEEPALAAAEVKAERGYGW